MKKQVSSQLETIETTVGELFEAVTQIALSAAKTEEEGYNLAALALADMLKGNREILSECCGAQLN